MSATTRFDRVYDPPRRRDAVDHHLALSQVSVRGLLRTTTSPTGTSTAVEDVSVELTHAADPAARERLEVGEGTQDLAVELTDDGRLRTLTYQRVGAGPAVVSAGTRLVGFLGSVALRFVTGSVASDSEPDTAATPDWPGETALTRSTGLADRASERLDELRDLLLRAETPARAREVDALARTVSSTLEAARADVARLGDLKAAWLESQRAERTASVAATVSLSDVTGREAGRPVSEPPEPPHDGPTLALWRDFRLVLELVDPRRGVAAPVSKSSTADHGNDRPSDRSVMWRVPRRAELWVWRAGTLEGQEDVLQLVSRAPVRIVDGLSEVAGLTLRDGAFGEHGLALGFADDGAPLTVTTSDKGAAAAVASALGEVPQELVGAVAQAQELVKGIDELRDADDVRAQAALERELAMARARTELLGVHATQAHAARLARLQQRADLQAARRTVSPGARELLGLQDELAEETARAAVEAARRTTAVETDLADVRAEVARLEAEVMRARARWEIDHPDQVEPA